MANVLSNKLKYSKKDFVECDFPDNILNLWSYHVLKEYYKKCVMCQTYSKSIVDISKDQWLPKHGDFEFVIDKIIQNDKSFYDFSKMSTSDRWTVLDILKKKNM